MLKTIPYLLLILLLAPTVALAKSSVDVEISNNLPGSNNQVNVNSNTSSNQPSSGSVQNQTDIVINNNGEKKEYHGSGGDIQLRSGDGNSSVSVNTIGASSNSYRSSSSVNSTTNITVNSNTHNASSAASEATVAGIFKEEKAARLSFWENLKKEFESFFKLFF